MRSPLTPVDARTGHAMPIFQSVYDSLLLREPDGTLSPMLATKWEYDESLTKLTIDLRTGRHVQRRRGLHPEAAKANLEGFTAANGRQAAQAKALESVTSSTRTPSRSRSRPLTPLSSTTSARPPA